jgi:hypothetical protein
MSRQFDRRTYRRNSLVMIETLESRTLMTGSTIDVTSSADSGSGTLRQAILDADSMAGQECVSIVFDLPTTDPGYNWSTGVWTICVASTLPAISGSMITIDSSNGPIDIPGGIAIQGISGSTNSLTLIGDGQDSAVDEPDPATTGTGSLTDGGLAIEYSGIGSLSASNLSSLTLETPNPGNVLTIGSPATAENQISGSSGGVAIAPLTFASVTTMTVETATNDNAGSDDSITIPSSGLVAAGLENFAVDTGATNATLTVLAPSLALPVAGGSFSDNGSSGYYNTVVAQADVNYSLYANGLVIPGSGTLSLGNVQDVQLTGGPDSTSFLADGWAGDLGLDGGPGSDQLVFDEPGSYSGNLTLSDFASTSIQIQGDFLGTITAPQTSTIQQLLIAGDDEPGSTITAGAFGSSTGSTSPTSGGFGSSLGSLFGSSIGSTSAAVQVLGDFGGSITASENLSIPGSGMLSSMEIDGNLLASNGQISAGGIGSLTVGEDLAGVVTAAGAGTIGTITVGGNLTGTVSAPEDPSPGSGTIGTVTVGGTLTGTISSGNISKVTIGKALIGVIIASGAGTIGSVVVGGDLSGQVIAQLDPNSSTSAELVSITVDGTLTGTISAVRQIGEGVVNSIGSTGSIDGGNVTSNLSIGTMNGTVNLGAAQAVEYQALGPNSVIDATSITSLTIDQSLAGLVDVTGDLGSVTIGQDLSGEIEVGGTLGSLSVGGATPGSVVAGHVGTISAAAAIGPVVLQIEDDGVERQLQAATAGNPFPLPGQTATGTLAQTTFRYIYESGTLANPQLTVQVDNQSGSAAPDQFDLSLVTDSATAKFNLARLDAIGVSGIGNVTVEGDILTSVTSQAQAFFLNDTSPAGVQLPLDNLAGIGVRDFIPDGGYINAASIQAIAVGLVGMSWGQSVPVADASAYEVQSLLSPTTRLVEANDTFRVPFTGSSTYQVGFFMDDNPWGQLDWDDVAFTIQSDVSINAAGTANVVTPSNVARGADVALIQVGSTSLFGGSQIEGITIQGDGASLSTYQSINGPIVSTGSLGDLTLLGSTPVQGISASSIFGTITSYAAIDGTIQTTGLWTNPISGLVSDTSGNFGRVYLNAWNHLTTTTFETYSGSFSGQLIVRGNLISDVVLNGNSTGVIAVQGNIGTTLWNNQLGGITINGNDTGSIVALEQILGDLTIYGNLGKGGSIVSSQGILGNLTIYGSMATGSKIVSGGVIGNASSGTRLTVYGNLQGLIASEGNLIEWLYDLSPSNTFANASSNPNEAAIDAVLAGSAAGYDDIMTMMAELHIDKEGELSVIAGS